MYRRRGQGRTSTRFDISVPSYSRSARAAAGHKSEGSVVDGNIIVIGKCIEKNFVQLGGLPSGKLRYRGLSRPDGQKCTLWPRLERKPHYRILVLFDF